MSQEEESRAKRKSKSTPPEQTEDRKWLISYPVYVVRTTRVAALEAELVLVGGGGGQSKTGVPNAFDIFLTKQEDSASPLEFIHHEDCEDRIIYSAAFHPSEPIIAVSQQNKCWIYKISAKDKKDLKTIKLEQVTSFQTDFEGPDSVQNICEFSPDGKWLATAGEEGVIRLWSIDLEKGSPSFTKNREIKFDTSINALNFSSDSQTMIYTSKQNCHIYEIENKKVIQSVTPVASPAGSSFRGCAFVHGSASEFIAGQGKPRFRSLVTRWNTNSGSCIRKVSSALDGPQTGIASYYNPESEQQVLAVSFGEGDLEVFSVAKNKSVSRLMKKKEVHSFIVTSAAITSDAKYIVSGSVDRSVAITPLVRGSTAPVLQWILFFVLVAILFLFLVFFSILGVYPTLQVIAGF